MSRPVRARRLTQDEGAFLLRLVRRGRADTIRYRRALMILASSSGTTVRAIAPLVAAHPDTVRDVIHVLHERKGGIHTLAALKSIRAARPDGAPIYVIEDNLSANTTPAIRTWAAAHKVELCLTPTNASWANPIEAQFGPLRQFTMANSDYPNHLALARDLHVHLRWRNASARHPDVIAVQRRECARARVRSEHHRRWGRPQQQAA